MTTNHLSVKVGLLDRVKPCHEGEISRDGSPSTLGKPRSLRRGLEGLTLSNKNRIRDRIYYKRKEIDFKG